MDEKNFYQQVGKAYIEGKTSGMEKQALMRSALALARLGLPQNPEGWQADELADERHDIQNLFAADVKNDADAKEMYDALLNRMTPDKERAAFTQQMLNHADGVADIAGRPRTGWTEFGDLLGSEGKGTAIRGLGGAGLGYLLGDKLGNHGLLGAALGGAAGLTPEIMKYAPKAIDAIKDLFSKKASANAAALASIDAVPAGMQKQAAATLLGTLGGAGLGTLGGLLTGHGALHGLNKGVLIGGGTGAGVDVGGSIGALLGHIVGGLINEPLYDDIANPKVGALLGGLAGGALGGAHGLGIGLSLPTFTKSKKDKNK